MRRHFNRVSQTRQERRVKQVRQVSEVRRASKVSNKAKQANKAQNALQLIGQLSHSTIQLVLQ